MIVGGVTLRSHPSSLCHLLSAAMGINEGVATECHPYNITQNISLNGSRFAFLEPLWKCYCLDLPVL
jgi:hypothetical protein